MYPAPQVHTSSVPKAASDAGIWVTLYGRRNGKEVDTGRHQLRHHLEPEAYVKGPKQGQVRLMPRKKKKRLRPAGAAAWLWRPWACGRGKGRCPQWAPELVFLGDSPVAIDLTCANKRRGNACIACTPGNNK